MEDWVQRDHLLDYKRHEVPPLTLQNAPCYHISRYVSPSSTDNNRQLTMSWTAFLPLLGSTFFAHPPIHSFIFWLTLVTHHCYMTFTPSHSHGIFSPMGFLMHHAQWSSFMSCLDSLTSAVWLTHDFCTVTLPCTLWSLHSNSFNQVLWHWSLLSHVPQKARQSSISNNGSIVREIS